MEIDVRQVEGVIILDMEGRLTAGTGDRVLREAMNQLVADGLEENSAESLGGP